MSDSAHPAPLVVVVVSDLMMRSRLEEGLRAAGYRFRAAAGATRLKDALAEERPACVVVDLETDGVDTIGLIEEVQALPGAAGVPVLAFCSHIAADLMSRAREAGSDRVVARSQVAGRLDQLLEGLGVPSEGESPTGAR